MIVHDICRLRSPLIIVNFSCSEQLNRWPGHWLTHSLTYSGYFYFWHTKSNPRPVTFETFDQSVEETWQKRLTYLLTHCGHLHAEEDEIKFNSLQNATQRKGWKLGLGQLYFLFLVLMVRLASIVSFLQSISMPAIADVSTGHIFILYFWTIMSDQWWSMSDKHSEITQRSCRSASTSLLSCY